MKQEMPLVTIITVTFNLIKANREKTFRQCLESVHNQTYKNIEHIIIDGASTDGTLDLIKEYSDKGYIKYISEPDSGIYNAMNKGIKIANGEYVAFLNSDDFYHNLDAVKISIDALENSSADFSYANFIEINGDKKVIVKWKLEKFLYAMPFGHPTMFTKKSVLLCEGGFNEIYKIAADYDLIIRLILKDYKSVYVCTDFVSYRYGGVCCVGNQSDEIAQIYMSNYSSFCKSLNIEWAKKIIFESKLPNGFIADFKEYARKNRYKNIDIDKVVSYLLCDKKECHNENNNRNLDYMGEGIPVFLSSDNNYAPFVATTICSILDHTKSHVDFYILDGGISALNIEKIKSLSGFFLNFSIEFLKIDKDKEFRNFPTRKYFPADMYMRFLIPTLKPTLKKVIYSDVDVIFNGDIKELINEDLGQYILGAVPYIYAYLNPNKTQIKNLHRDLKLSPEHIYFESGLLIINVESWLKNNITQNLVKVALENTSNLFLTPDQDVLNIVFENNYRKLDYKYIVGPSRTEIMSASPITKKSIENPFIYHYAGLPKPWNNPRMEMGKYFWKYARQTPFYEELALSLYDKGFNRKDINNDDKLQVKKKISIMFDATVLIYGSNKDTGRTGIFFATFNILKCMMKRKDLNVLLFCPKVKLHRLQKVLRDNFSGLDLIILTEEDLNNGTKYVYDIKNIDVFLSPIYNIPSVMKSRKDIIRYTILYDAIVLISPEYFPIIPTWFSEMIDGINPNDRYFAISENTKNDFIRCVPKITPGNIIVTHLAASENFFQNRDTKKKKTIFEKYKIETDKKYIFSLCTLEPRKNLIIAVKSFIKFIDKNNINDLVFLLGGTHWDEFIGKLEKEITKFKKYKDKIIRVGYINDEDLSVFYSFSEFFVYPSLYEGFGLPVLEAMKCGVPVITSNNSSLPEVIGDASLIIDPKSEKELADAFEKLYFDDGLKAELSRKGLKRAELFSWEKTVDIMVKDMFQNVKNNTYSFDNDNKFKKPVYDIKRKIRFFYYKCFNLIKFLIFSPKQFLKKCFSKIKNNLDSIYRKLPLPIKKIYRCFKYKILKVE